MNKIYFFANCHTSPNQISGGDVRFREISKRLNIFEKHVVTTKFGWEIYKNDKINAKYHLTSENKNMNIIFSYLIRCIKSLFLTLDVSDKDILYPISDFLPNVVPAFFYKVKKDSKWAQPIFHLYKNPLKRKGNNFLTNVIGFLSQRLSFLLIKRFADVIITTSYVTKKELLDIGFDNSKIKINYCGIDRKKINKIKPVEKTYDCVFLGRLNVSKGIFDLIDIWKYVTKKNQNVTLSIIGGGNKKLEKELKYRVKINNLEKNISVLGFLKDEYAFSILSSSKIFIFPSHEEGFGISILEAMGLGKPCIVWDLPVYRSIFRNGLIKIPQRNTQLYAEKIIQLLKDESIMNKFSKEAEKEAKRYDWDKIVEQEIKLLRRLLK